MMVEIISIVGHAVVEILVTVIKEKAGD